MCGGQISPNPSGLLLATADPSSSFRATASTEVRCAPSSRFLSPATCAERRRPVTSAWPHARQASPATPWRTSRSSWRWTSRSSPSGWANFRPPSSTWYWPGSTRSSVADRLAHRQVGGLAKLGTRVATTRAVALVLAGRGVLPSFACASRGQMLVRSGNRQLRRRPYHSAHGCDPRLSDAPRAWRGLDRDIQRIYCHNHEGPRLDAR